MSDKPITKEEQRHLETLVNRCMVFTDRNGKVLHKDSNPVCCSLSMKYKKEDLTIEFSAYANVHSNGSCYVQVQQKGEVVLNASGNFTASAFNITAETYVPGNWEKKIPEKFDR